jgi:hypothetical protein
MIAGDTFDAVVGWLFWPVVIAVAVLYFRWKRWVAAQEREKKTSVMESIVGELGAVASMSVGEYVTGLPHGTLPRAVSCAVTDVALVFFDDMTGNRLGEIPRGAVTGIEVSDESHVNEHVQTLQRLTLTRMVTLGVFSLAAPKRKTVTTTTVTQKYVLLLAWRTEGGMGEVARFKFADLAGANAAANTLRQYATRR